MKKNNEFSIGYNHDIKLLDLLDVYKDNIKALYFPIPKRYLGSGRNIPQPKGYENEISRIIKRCDSLNITSQLLLNSTYERSKLSKNLFEKLIGYIKKLRNMGLESVVVTNPVYISRLKKQVPDIRIESSINCYVKTVEHALYLKDLGVDVLTIDRDINRNIPLIKEIKNKTNLKIKIMLNEGCLRNCPFRVMHYNYLSQRCEIKKPIDGIFLDKFCIEIYLKNPAKVFSIPFIPPDALSYYAQFVDYYKLSTRVFSTDRIELCLKAYISGQFNGNLLRILDCPGLSYFEYIDYRVLKRNNFFEKMINCTNHCNKCGYCKFLIQKATLIKRDFLKQRRKEEERKAIRIYTNVLKCCSNKDEAFIYLCLGRAHFQLKRYGEAIKKINKVIELKYKRSGAHSLLGFCYERMGQYRKAIEEFEKEERINPKDARINFSLAKCYRNIGKIEPANKELDKGIHKIKALR